MTIQSFPLIAIDFNNNERHVEWSGHSQGDAAKRLLREHPHYKAALNGKESGGSNNPYRKLIATQHGVETDATQTSFGQAFMQAQSTQSLEAGRLILNALQKKGLRLEVGMDEQTNSHKIYVRPRGVITPEERREIDENQASILVLLEEQQREAPLETPDSSTPKETQRYIIRKMLPELPEYFDRSDLQKVLRHWEYNDLAEKTSKLDSLLAWCATEGLVSRIGKGRYQSVIPAKVTISESSPVTPSESTAAVNDLVTAPAEPVEPTEALVYAIEKTPDMTPQPIANTPSSFTQTLIDLTSQLAESSIDDSKLEVIERGAKELYDAFEKFTDSVDALIKQLRNNNRAREYFRTQLSCQDRKSNI